jgi:hypothetical protein
MARKLMTAKKLIEKLKRLPAGSYVFVEGYEGGLEVPKVSPLSTIDINVIDAGVYGPHAYEGCGWVEATKTVFGVVLSR